MSMESYGDTISKCHIMMNKRTPVPGYRLLSSPSMNLKLQDYHYLYLSWHIFLKAIVIYEYIRMYRPCVSIACIYQILHSEVALLRSGDQKVQISSRIWSIMLEQDIAVKNCTETTRTNCQSLHAGQFLFPVVAYPIPYHAGNTAT